MRSSKTSELCDFRIPPENRVQWQALEETYVQQYTECDTDKLIMVMKT